VNSGEFKAYGITSTTDVRYDSHLFLNALRIHLTNGGFGNLVETKAFLDRVVPDGYRDKRGKYVRESRMVGKTFPNLPTFTEILADPYFSGTKSSPARNRNVNSPVVRNVNTAFNNVFPYHSPPPANRHVATALANRSGNNAVEIARRALANIPGVAITTTSTTVARRPNATNASASTTGARRPSAANFLRMSPRTRAAHMTGARGARNASRTVMVLNVTRGRGANRERLTARRVPAPARAVSRLPLGTGSRVTAAPGLYPEIRRGGAPPPRPPVRSPAAPPALRARVNAGTLLDLFTKTHNARLTTKKNLKAELVQRGYAPTSARREVANWLPRWEASRHNVGEATRLAKMGINLNYRGYAPNVAVIAKRHANLALTKSPGGRVRGGKALLLGKKRDELVNMARRHGLVHSGKTKAQLVNALYG
jgi:hypothetical protein